MPRFSPWSTGGALTLAAIMLVAMGPALAASPSALRARQVATWGVPALWHSGSIAAVAFSQDGQRALVATRKVSFTSWELASLQQKESVDVDDHAWTAAFASNGRVAYGLTLDAGGFIEVWDHMEKGSEPLYSIPGPDSDITALSFSADGTRLAAGADSGPVLLWDLSRKPRVRKLRGPTWRTFAVAVSADGSRVVASGDRGKVWVWDARSGRLLRTLQANSSIVGAVAVSADGQRVLSGGEDRMARLWDVRSGKVLWSSGDEGNRVQAVALAPDGTRAVTAASAVKLWDVPSGQVLATLRKESVVHALALSADTSLVAVGQGPELRLLDVRSGQEIRQARGSHTDHVTSLAVNPQGTRVASGSQDGTVRLWDTEHGTAVAVLSGHTHWVDAVAFSKDGKRVLSASEDETIRSWDATSGGPGQVLAKIGTPATTLVASPTEPLVVFAGWKGPLHLWNLDEEKEQRTLGEEDPEHVVSVVFSPDGRRLFEVRADGTIGAWDVASGRLVQTLGVPGSKARKLAGGGDTLCSITEGDLLQFWNIRSGELTSQIEPHQGGVYAVAVSPDGRLAISLGTDATLRIWDSQTGTLVDRIDFPPKGDTPSTVRFEPGGRAFLVGTDRGLILRYALESP